MSKLDELLGSTFNCRCGQCHTVTTQMIVYTEDAITRIPSVLQSCIKGQRIVLLADIRTWAIAGEEARKSLEKEGWSCHVLIIPDREHKSPVCNDITFHELSSQFPQADAALAIGCGVVGDLTKWLAFEHQIPFAVLATAATMNGFTSANVAPTIKGVKTLLVARPPLAVFAVPSIIIEAPFELTAAGLGDVIAKPVSTADWIMNHIFNEEHFCSTCSEMINSLETCYFDHPERIRDRNPEAMAALMNSLFYSGVAMTIIGTSAPASGGEHLLSHTLDMISGIDGQDHDLHGRQVGLGTIVASVLYEKLFEIETPQLKPLPEIDQTFWAQRIQSVRHQYEQKIPVIEAMRKKIREAGLWQEFLNRCRSLVRTPRQIKDCLKTAGAAHTYPDIGCSRDRVRTAILHMHEIRKRPTVVDLAWMLGILPGAVDEIIDRWLV
ncbi:MAG: iron-containing alcohol dehydrogenase [Sedimentisphaerales bacterium]|nr:iron-containing alcohol dehydrogenase [Sedimentisphaerales bacterium]